ncbi:MAG: [acyl-carrier-protein] S-malonyltransferase [Phycisphaerales bacterium]|jgi:[acyl-carrier-protein] S-malonyltransferase|nr:[acyl-carrier-protein] S-malonyltransferase [Phycisphaerales bacterium]
MPNITYILCPGQGAQSVGMGKDFHESSPAAKETFERANKILGFDLSSLCFAGPDERLNQTDISQPAIYVTSVAAHRAAVAAGVIKESGENTQYAGLSLGEYAALHLAGVFSFEDGLKLVAARGKYMQEAAVATPSSMVAIMGADEAAVTKLCDENAQGEVLVPANFNAPGQIVVSGSKAACDRVLSAASAGGFKAVALVVAGAFHSPIMQRGADRMKAELERVPFNAPRATVYSNVTAAPHTDTASIKKLLVDQIVKPVRWEQTMQKIAPTPDARFVELAPGRVLTGLLKKINRRIPVETLSTADALKGSTT